MAGPFFAYTRKSKGSVTPVIEPGGLPLTHRAQHP
jgi:hypothetical protein